MPAPLVHYQTKQPTQTSFGKGVASAPASRTPTGHFLLYSKPMIEATGFITAGGKSSRMGEDKAWLKLGGRTMIEHVIAAVVARHQEIGDHSQQPGLPPTRFSGLRRLEPRTSAPSKQSAPPCPMLEQATSSWSVAICPLLRLTCLSSW